MTSADLTTRLATYCQEARGTDHPPEVRDRLAKHVLDHVGLVVGSHPLAASTHSIEAGIEALEPEGSGGATALATGRSYAVDHAALLNGALAHSLDFDDTHRESSLHPGAPVIPAALAMGEIQESSGTELLAAIEAGYDVSTVVGRAVNPDAHYDRGFHVTATCGTFGATAAAGVLAGLSAEECENAFGINGSQVAGSLQFLENGAWNKRVHPGLAASRGVTAVTMAKSGFTGATAPIEGTYGFFTSYSDDPRPEAFDSLGTEHSILDTAVKPFPCCRYMHSAIDGLIDLSATIDPQTVESITVELPKPGVRLTGDPIEAKRRPDSLVDAQFSMPFTAAVALLHGDAGLETFLEAVEQVDGQDYRDLMNVTDVIVSDRVQSLFPQQWAAHVSVTAAGETRERFVETAPGEPERPLDWATVREKFVELTDAAGWTESKQRDVVETVRDLDEHTVPELISRMTDDT